MRRLGQTAWLVIRRVSSDETPHSGLDVLTLITVADLSQGLALMGCRQGTPPKRKCQRSLKRSQGQTPPPNYVFTRGSWQPQFLWEQNSLLLWQDTTVRRSLLLVSVTSASIISSSGEGREFKLFSGKLAGLADVRACMCAHVGIYI